MEKRSGPKNWPAAPLEVGSPRLTEEGPAARIGGILQRLSSLPGVRGVAIADHAGLPVASELPGGAKVLEVTAMTTLALQSCSSVLRNLTAEGLETIMIEGATSTIVIHALGQGQLGLFCVLDKTGSVGLVWLESRRCARELEEVLGV